MTIRVAAIEVSHWHVLNDAAYLGAAAPDNEIRSNRMVFASS
jgi:hypothetical protein